MTFDRKHFRQRCTWPIWVAAVTVVFFVLFYAYDASSFSGDSSVIAYVLSLPEPSQSRRKGLVGYHPRVGNFAILY